MLEDSYSQNVQRVVVGGRKERRKIENVSKIARLRRISIDNSPLYSSQCSDDVYSVVVKLPEPREERGKVSSEKATSEKSWNWAYFPS